MAFLLAQQDGGDLSGSAWSPLLQETGLPLAIMGILVVFAALVLVSLFIALLPRAMELLKRVHPEAGETKPTSAPKKAASQAAEEEGELLVVIAAAAAECLGEPHRIVHIRGLTPEDMSWSFEGRLMHHRSHTIQRRDSR
jgi:sodium pump decarboxylase gamma subunit